MCGTTCNYGKYKYNLTCEQFGILDPYGDAARRLRAERRTFQRSVVLVEGLGTAAPASPATSDAWLPVAPDGRSELLPRVTADRQAPGD
jgi:hypothetical protein